MTGRVKIRLMLLLAVLVVGGQACGSLMHPRADEFLKQAQGPTGVETALNLIDMMEGSIGRAMEDSTDERSLADLHDQFHALCRSFCQVTDTQASTPSYVKAVTLEQEMRTVFHRLWKFRTDPVLREIHLNLFGVRLEELRQSLQSVEG